MSNVTMLVVGLLMCMIAIIIMVGNFLGENSIIGGITLGGMGIVFIAVSSKTKKPN